MGARDAEVGAKTGRIKCPSGQTAEAAAEEPEKKGKAHWVRESLSQSL